MKVALLVLILSVHLAQGTWSIYRPPSRHFLMSPPVDWRREIKQFYARWETLWDHGDITTLVTTLFSRRPVVLRPTRPTLRDPNAQIAIFNQLFKDGFTKVELKLDEIVQTCDRSSATVLFTIRRTNLNGQLISSDGVMVLERPGGRLKLKLAIG